MAEVPGITLYQTYREHLSLLTHEQIGDVIMALYAYANGEDTPELAPIAQMAYSFMRAGYDRDKEKYNAICERNRSNGQKAAAKSRPPKEPVEPSGGQRGPKEPVGANKNKNKNLNRNIPPAVPQGDVAGEIAELCRTYETLFGILPRAVVEDVKEYLADGLSAELVKRILSEAAGAEARKPMQYIRTVAGRCKAGGITTVEQFEQSNKRDAVPGRGAGRAAQPDYTDTSRYEKVSW